MCTQLFPLRYAAVSALNHLNNIWQQGSSTKPESLAIHAASLTYTALNDDDDDIRDLAARVAHVHLEKNGSFSNRTLAPLIASRGLATHLAAKYPQSPLLLRIAIQRMTGSKLDTYSLVPSVQIRFASTLNEAAALFAIEKQNLYIDYSREAAVWSTALKRLSVRRSSKGIVEALTAWAVEGLDLIIATAESEIDGALGWTSRPNMFVLSVQILFAAGVLLKWRSQSKIVPVTASALMVKLARVQALGAESKVHHMWAELAGKTLEEAVVLRLGRVTRSLAVVMGTVLDNTGPT